MSGAPITGGCQCGKVRYEIAGELFGSHFCHCRMCQRAVGNVFAALVGAKRTDVTWTAGAPAVFESSSVAERGFCRDCGTPLTFAYKDSRNLNITIGSLDHPERAPIGIHYGVESRVPWLKLCDGLPEEATSDEEGSRLAGMVSRQGPVET